MSTRHISTCCSATNSLCGVSNWTSFVDPQKSSFLYTNVTYSNKPCSNKIYLLGFYQEEIWRYFFSYYVIDILFIFTKMTTHKVNLLLNRHVDKCRVGKKFYYLPGEFRPCTQFKSIYSKSVGRWWYGHLVVETFLQVASGQHRRKKVYSGWSFFYLSMILTDKGEWSIDWLVLKDRAIRKLI